jgi:hypothetical protein
LHSYEKLFFLTEMNVSAGRQQILSWEEWQARMESHWNAARAYTSGTRFRRDCGKSHPVEDFLFTYYPYPVALIEQWQPTLGEALEFHDIELLAPRFTGKRYRREAGICALDPNQISEKELQRLNWIRGLLEATQRNPPNFACHGLHEWAMVYRAEDIRHASTTPLRLSQAEIDSVVESRSILCSHHDAFRFFSKQAQPLNRLFPSIDTRHENEQGGCIHANMDLYKWACKAMPWIGTELLFECFRLAVRLRDLDMRASPYDLTEWNLAPVKTETAEGRKEYEQQQRSLAYEAQILRAKLIRAISEIGEAYSHSLPA